MQSTPSPPPGIPVAPAPWTCKCETYWLLTWLPAGTLPDGLYDPLEAASPAFADPERAGKFRGGLGMIQIVRYTETPVGPYDELLIIPGAYTVAAPPQRQRAVSRKRIARIYVSQRSTCYNGRRNWNIPKHLARFVFSSPAPAPATATATATTTTTTTATATTTTTTTTSPPPTSSSSSPPPHALHVAVYPPEDGEEGGSGGRQQNTLPFFSCTLTPFRTLPALPFSTSYLPLSTTLMQPPLPSAADSSPSTSTSTSTSDRPDPVLLAGTTAWRSFAPSVDRARARGMWVEMHVPKGGGDGDGEREASKRWWPMGVRPFRLGMWLEGVEMGFPVGEEWA